MATLAPDGKDGAHRGGHSRSNSHAGELLEERQLFEIVKEGEAEEPDDVIPLRGFEVSLAATPSALNTNVSLVKLENVSDNKKFYFLPESDADGAEWISALLGEIKKRATLDWGQVRSVILGGSIKSSSGHSDGQSSKSLSTKRVTKLALKEKKKKEALIKSKIRELNSIWIDPSQVECRTKIGSGSFGTVYSGFCRGSDCAIKVLHNQKLDLSGLSDFISEIEIMAKVHHPHVHSLLGACLQPLMIITELKTGSVEDFILDRSIDSPLILRLRLAKDMARGLAWLHLSEPMIVHRDIKPANFLIDEHLRVCVTDFGLSDSLRPGSETLEHQYKGSAFFSAPEILRNLTFNETSDIFSFGIVLWFMMTRTTPYPEVPDKTSVQETLEKVIWNGYRPEMPPDVSEDIADLIRRCWDGDAKKRPTSLALIDELDTMIQKRAIPDAGGRAFWLEHFHSHRGTAKNKFFEALQLTLPRLSFDDVKAIYTLLMCHLENRVSADRFGALLEWFGPWQNFVANIRAALAIHPPGSFLVRLAPSQPGWFALDYLNDENRVQEVLIAHVVVSDVSVYKIGEDSFESLTSAVQSVSTVKDACPQSPLRHHQIDRSFVPKFADHRLVDDDIRCLYMKDGER